MRTINETVADMGGQEIGRLVVKRYYAEEAQGSVQQVGGETSAARFNKMLRETRLTVDKYLAEGQVDAAEAFMEERRQMLAAEGFPIRKLNQAYFAFHGAYADSPASVSPIGAELAQLRAKSGSLGAFLKTVSGVSSYEELEALLR